MNSGPPYQYPSYNYYNSLSTPSTMHVTNTGLSWFFQRYLFQRILSVFKWTLPEWWASNYFLNVLYNAGFICVIKTDKFGVIPQNCGLYGFDVFYQPTHCIVQNQLIYAPEPLAIGDKCALIKLSPDYGGVYDLVSYYADQLALCAQALAVNLVNSKVAYVFKAPNQAAANTLKAMYDKIMAGEPAVFPDVKVTTINKDTPSWEFFQQNVSQNHIAGNLLDEMRTIQDMFDTEVGIPNANTQKKERLNTAEVYSNNIETLSKASLWMDCIREGLEQVRKMYDIEIAVNWRFRPEGPITIGGSNNDSKAFTGGIV